MTLDKSGQDTECKGGGPDSAAWNEWLAMIATTHLPHYKPSLGVQAGPTQL